MAASPEHTSDFDLNPLVLDAILAWIDLCGIDVDAARGDLRGPRRVNFGLLGNEEQARHLEDSHLLDPSGVTTFMLLRRYLRDWMKARTFTMWDFVTAHHEVEQESAKAAELWMVLECPPAVAIMEDWMLQLLGQAEQWCIEQSTREDLSAWVDEPYQLALLRLDALRAVDGGPDGVSDRKHYRYPGLELHTFLDGPRSGSTTPVLVPEVYEFWNVNSFLAGLRSARMPDACIVVSLIRDPEALHSFFVLGVRDGESLHMLTDRSKELHTHPLRKQMSRRPDRELESRASQWWFPYELLDVKPTEDGKRLYAEARTALVPIDSKGVPLKKISELHPASLLWLMMVLDIVRQRFFIEARSAPQLSYTGEMVRVPHALAAEHSALVRAGHYQALELPPIDPEIDLSPEAMARQTGRKTTGHWDWMVQRYGDRVSAELLDVVGDGEKAALLETTVESLPSLKGNAVGYDHHTEPRRRDFLDHDRGLQALDPTSFGSPEDLRKDQVWLAQYNRCSAIQRLANEEYRATLKSVIDWYHDKLRARREWLIDQCASLSLVLPAWRQLSNEERKEKLGTTNPFVHGESRWSYERDDGQAIIYGVGRSSNPWSDTVGWHSGGERMNGWVLSGSVDRQTEIWDSHGTQGRRLSALVCVEDGGTPTVFCLINVRSSRAVAALLDIPHESLPWQVHQAIPEVLEPYTGNSILDRIDPVDFTLKNPWSRLLNSMGLFVAFSRRGIDARRRRLGLDKVDWKSLEAPKARRRSRDGW